MSVSNRAVGLGLGLAGLTLLAGFLATALAPTGYCGRHPGPGSWIYLVLLIFAWFAFGFGVMRLSVSPRTRAHWVTAVVGFSEAAAAIGLLVYITAKFMHAYDCG